MKLILNNFEPNGLVNEPPGTMSDLLIDMHTDINQTFLQDVEYIRPLLDYGESWTSNTDIFQYLKEESLNKLRNGKCIMVFDASMEGFSPYEFPLAQTLHHQCINYGIDPRKIYLLTANFKENDCHNNYLGLNKYLNGINILETTLVGDMALPNNDVEGSVDFYEMCKKMHSDKMFLQLSRRNRPYRVIANYLNSTSDISNYGLISQDKLTDDELYRTFYEFKRSPYTNEDITEKELRQWNKKLPLIVDNKDFEINWANWRSSNLYHKTIFSIVLETSQQDYGGTTMFPSEKIFKAILHKQPFVVFGHRGINSFLNLIGFRSYETWFDIQSFDFEIDPVERFQKLKNEVTKVIGHLKNLSIQERVDWRFKNQDILDYNYNLIVSGELRQREVEKLHKTIDSYFKNHFYSYLSANPNFP